MLVLISAGLSFDVGRQIAQVAGLVRGLTARTYPNRTMDLAAAEDRISAELTRSRRYHHPLSLLLLEVGSFSTRELAEHPALQRDILTELATAKVGQIINERARETDLIMRDEQGRFVILCPETTHENSVTLARRIEESVSTIMGTNILWGSAFFPSEALTFEDLVQRAERRLEEPEPPMAQAEPVKGLVEEPVEMSEKTPQ
jgi:GGDEF domain-containing protein